MPAADGSGELPVAAGLMVDGVYVGEHCCVVAVGIGLDGAKIR